MDRQQHTTSPARDVIEPGDLPHSLIDILVEAVDQTFDAITITDVQLDEPGPRIVYANPAFCRMTGYSSKELVGQTPRLLQGPNTDRRVLDRLRDDLERTGSFQGRVINYRRDGTEFVMEWSISTVRGDDGDPQFYVAIQRDATTFRRLLEDAERLARTDALTGLANRRFFDAHLSAALANPLVTGHVGLVTLDIDHFKSVNDTFGHPAGDAVLCEVSRRMRETVPPGSLVARTGGEELAIIMDDAQDIGAVAAVAERLRSLLDRRPVVAAGQALSITASFGVAHAIVSGQEPQQLIADADHALYASKAAGRNCITSFTIGDRWAREQELAERPRAQTAAAATRIAGGHAGRGFPM